MPVCVLKNLMNKTLQICTGTAVVAVLTFQQLEIQSIHDDIQDVKAFVIQTDQRLNYTRVDYDCLAKNIYHEAGVESRAGQFAVAQVTLNRLRTGRWGTSICSVVYSPSQFSWTLNHKLRQEQPRGPLWEQSKAVASGVLDKGYRVPQLETAILYHADYVKPYWAKSVKKIQQVGQHIFYKPVDNSTI
jgi:spore germination cell wall hydrolase CwlJ-like protein